MGKDSGRQGIEPARLDFDEAGLPYSARYADRYASRDGALGQARHVFLGGNGLPGAWAARRQFVVLETGFGLGTNFLATWQAWRADPGRPQRLHFVSIEKHPLRVQDIRAPVPAAAPGSDDGLGALRDELAQRWPLPLPGLHRIEFEGGRVILTLALGDAAALAPRLLAGVDAFYLDGFAPDRNPDMWSAPLLRALARLARPEATLATYTCARPVRDALAACGFAVELAPGFGSKRQMLRARYRPAWKMRRHEPRAPYEGRREAIVVGAGLAACSCAHALARRGWHVRLLERGATVAPGASGLPAGLLHPLLSRDDNRTSRLTRAGFAFALAQLRGFEGGATAPADPAAALWRACGVFQEAENDEEDARMAALARPWPEAFAAHRSAAALEERLGLRPVRGGLWFEHGAIVSSARWCERLLQGCPTLDLRLDTGVESLDRDGPDWLLRDARGAVHRAPLVVLANGLGLTRLRPAAAAPLQPIGGRITLLQAPALAQLRAGVSGDGYALPPLLGRAAVGATYELAADRGDAHGPQAAGPPPGGALADDSAAAHAENLQRLARLFADPLAARVAGVFSGHRCVAPDRLPLAGAMADEEPFGAEPSQRLAGSHAADLRRLPGLFCLAALGSRGLCLAALLAEHVAAGIEGEPAPIESDLADAVDPGRFLLRAVR
jgi:tRNA 5-methylaminomethyl-2-thiouridine biosynthesis bifunctional protein